MNKRGIVKGLMVFLLFGLAVALTMYPYISNWLFEHQNESLSQAVEQTAQELDTSEQEAQLAAAREYNEILAGGHITLTDPFEASQEDDGDEYYSLLNLTDDGVMGTVEIPVIDVSLPIYHGTSEEVLQKGVGHLEGTSLPVGGESTHAVLTGHTGLSRAKMFTDLTEMQEGDIFFLHVMGEILAYKVDQIKVVLPTELGDLTIVPGQDYCTLVTCTPYGVNTHRLLVRGVRTDYQEAVEDPATFEDRDVESRWMEEYKKALIISFVCFVVILSVVGVVRYVRSRSRSKKE